MAILDYIFLKLEDGANEKILKRWSQQVLKSGQYEKK